MIYEFIYLDLETQTSFNELRTVKCVKIFVSSDLVDSSRSLTCNNGGISQKELGKELKKKGNRIISIPPKYGTIERHTFQRPFPY